MLYFNFVSILFRELANTSVASASLWDAESHSFCFIIVVVDIIQEWFLHVVWLTNHSHWLSFKWCLWHQVHQLLLHAPMIGILPSRLFDIATYLLPFLLIVPCLDSLNQGVIAVEYQFADTSLVFAYQFLYIITVDEQWYMFAQRHGYGIRSIGSVLLQYLWDGFLVPSFHRSSRRSRAVKSSLSLGSKLTSSIR